MLRHNNIDVPPLSFGAAGLGGVYSKLDDSEALRTVRSAIDQGIRLIDTSPYYGLGKSEATLGKVLPEIPRDQFLLSTKCGRYGVDTFDFSAPRLTRSIDESLGRLGLDHVDILLLHDIEFTDLDSIVTGAIPALEEIKKAGKTRYIGISGLPLKVFETVVPQAPESIDFILSYCHLNLFDTTLLDLVPLLDKHGVDLINAAPTSMGLLTSQGPPDWHPAAPEIKSACAEAARFCEVNGLELADIAVAFACNHPSIPTTLVSAENRQRLQRNIELIGSGVDAGILSKVRTILSPILDRTWQSGLPENN